MVPFIDEMEKHNNEKARLKGDSYFKLIEYKELNEARKSSKKAFCIAIIAVALTLTSVLYQIFFSH